MQLNTKPRRTAREAILDAATLLLAESPAASMAAVAQAAGVGRATLYRHFASREELIKEISLESVRVTDEATQAVFAVPRSAEEYLLAMLEVLIPFGDRYHFLANEFQAAADPEVASESERQLAELAELVEQGKTEGLFAADLPTPWIVHLIDSLIWTTWSSIHRGELAPKEAARLAFRCLVDGTRPR